MKCRICKRPIESNLDQKYLNAQMGPTCFDKHFNTIQMIFTPQDYGKLVMGDNSPLELILPRRIFGMSPIAFQR